MRRQKASYGAGRHGTADQVALRLRAAVPAQAGHLLGRLDSLRRRLDPKAGAQPGDGAHDGGGAGAIQQVAHEHAVYLDLVEREAVEVAERAVAGAEVVQRDPHAKDAQLVQHGQGAGAVVQKHRFRDLQFEAGGRQDGSGQRGLQGLDQIRAAELYGGQVDRNAHRGRPGRRILARGAGHPRSDGHDQPRLLRQGDEIGRRHQAARRVLPAQQRLERDDLAGPQADEGLVEHPELLALDCKAQIILGLAAGQVAGVHRSLKEANGAALLGLRPVQRHVGMAQQGIRANTVTGADGNADADRRGHLARRGAVQAGHVQLERLGEGGRDPPSYPAGAVRQPGLGHHDRELVRAQPRNQVHLPHAGLHPLPGQLQ